MRSAFTNRIEQGYWWSICAVSHRFSSNGVQIWIFLPTAEEQRVAVPKAERAIELIATYHPRTLRRLRRLTRGVVIVGEHPGITGTWIRAGRLVGLSMHHILDPEADAGHIATTIAHECAHAWLDSCGIANDLQRRHRIEAICYGQEAAVARRLPGGAALANHYYELAVNTRAAGPERWSKAIRVQEDLDELERLGVPRWLRALLKRIANRKAN